MADEEKKIKKPKRRACAQSKKNVTRKTWYYREGEYFINKRAYAEWKEKKLEEQKEAAAKAKEAEEAKEEKAPKEAEVTA